MEPKLRRVLIFMAGWLFILVGLVGLVLPVLQGVLFLFVGLALLSRESERARAILQRLKKRFPRVAERLDRPRRRKGKEP